MKESVKLNSTITHIRSPRTQPKFLYLTNMESGGEVHSFWDWIIIVQLVFFIKSLVW